MKIQCLVKLLTFMTYKPSCCSQYSESHINLCVGVQVCVIQTCHVTWLPSLKHRTRLLWSCLSSLENILDFLPELGPSSLHPVPSCRREMTKVVEANDSFYRKLWVFPSNISSLEIHPEFKGKVGNNIVCHDTVQERKFQLLRQKWKLDYGR